MCRKSAAEILSPPFAAQEQEVKHKDYKRHGFSFECGHFMHGFRGALAWILEFATTLISLWLITGLPQLFEPV